MNEWEKQRREGIENWIELGNSSKLPIIILSQEKEMIREAFLEYFNKIKCKDICEFCDQTKWEINEILQSKGIEEI